MDILIPEELDSPAIQRLEKKFKIVHDPALWSDPARFKQRLGETRAVIARAQTTLTADLLSGAPNLIAIARTGVGLEKIDVKFATEKGIVIIAPLHANATSVAELTFGLMLALARKIPLADRSTKAGGWERNQCTGIELDRKTILVCGFGRIGRMVASRARAFGMRIIVFDPFIDADENQLGEVGATLVEKLEEAVSLADFVTVHMPLTSETKQMFNAKVFTAMKPGSFFINTSRGGVMDETALLLALENHLAGAALDVREVEPPVENSAFTALDKVILTPHIGAFTKEALKRTIESVCADLERVLTGEPAVNFVNIPKPGRH